MMKAILCLSFVCCFVAGALATCECEIGLMMCVCKPENKNGKYMI